LARFRVVGCLLLRRESGLTVYALAYVAFWGAIV